MERVVHSKLRLKGKQVDIHKIVKRAKRAEPEEPEEPIPEPTPEEEQKAECKGDNAGAGDKKTDPDAGPSAASGVVGAQEETEGSQKHEQVGPIIQPVEDGTGKVMTSQTTVHGKDTTFLGELERGKYLKNNKGDTLIIENDITHELEERKVTMVLSNKSLGIDEAFTKDVNVYTEFKYQKKPKQKVREKPIEQLVQEKLAAISQPHEKLPDQPATKKAKRLVEYRAKAGPWTYRTYTQEVEGELTHEQQLDLRVKKATDKFCWI
jgi:hypothetical protein